MLRDIITLCVLNLDIRVAFDAEDFFVKPVKDIFNSVRIDVHHLGRLEEGTHLCRVNALRSGAGMPFAVVMNVTF